MLAGCGGGSESNGTPSSDQQATQENTSEPTLTETQRSTPTDTATPEQPTPTAPPRLRAIDLSLYGEKELSFDGEVVTRSFQTSVVTEYQQVESGDIAVRAAPYASDNVERTVSVRSRGDHTVVLFGITGDDDVPLELRLFEDQNNIAPDATPRIRLINGSVNAGDLQLVATSYNTDGPIVDDVGYGEAAYGELPDSTQNGRSLPVGLKRPDSPTNIEVLDIEAPAGSVITVLAAGEYERNEPLTTEVIQDV